MPVLGVASTAHKQHSRRLMARSNDDPKRLEQEQAWTGDAVLGLFAREWILRREGGMDAEMFARMTSNHFLSSIGHPTSVEAAIGRVYSKDGLQAGFDHIESQLVPMFLKQERKRIRHAGGKR
jgi:hypothetical protein